MSRLLLCLAVVAAVVGTPRVSTAAESGDVQQVRQLLLREFEGAMQGDVEQLLSCYAPEFAGYYAYSAEPDDWMMGMVGLETLRKEYAEPHAKDKALWAKHPDWQRYNEVRHVDVMGDRAIATTKHFSSQPDSVAGTSIENSHRSVWMLRKIDGQWKITAFIAAIGFQQQVFQSGR